MPYLHCSKCHHEYETTNPKEPCDWCGAPGYVMEEKTPLEKSIKDIYYTIENIKEFSPLK